MNKFLKRQVSVLLILALMLSPVLAVSVRSAGTVERYDPFHEGIVSSYYHIDYEKGYITGIAPGTTAQQLLNVILPGGATVSKDQLATGVTVTVTCTEPVPPETAPEETTEPSTEGTEPPTETTEPPTETTEPPTESTEPPTETTEPPTETTEPPTETTEPPTETTEPPTETTEPPTESTEPPTETTEPPTETTEPPTETTEPPTETTEPPTETTEATEETTEPPTETTEPPTETTEATGESTGTFGLLRAAAPPATKTYTLTVIVTGDLNGDGNATITDALMIKSALLGKALSDTAAAAADLNYDGKVTITDFLKIKSCLLGLETVRAGWPAGKAPADPILLTTPGSTEEWSVQGAASYKSHDDAVASISENGTVTAGSAEGSTFLYALDESGDVIARTVITVLKEKLAVSLNSDSLGLVKGQAQTLSASLNHPVSVPVTWASSDSAIVSVDAGGKLTAKGLGSATVTASLPNGSKATCKVSVIPPLTAITFEKNLYKVKPGNSRTLGVILTPADTGEELIWSSSNTSIAKVNDDGTVTGVANGTVTVTVKGKYSGLTATCKVKVCNVKQVAITFDDGPSPETAALLEYLREAQIPATFFMVGNRLESYSNTVKQMVADGHEIGYHSYAHVLQSYLTDAEIKADYQYSSKILKKLTGVEFTVWRTPGGDYSTRILNCVPLPHIMWSVDTRDWETQSSDSNYRSITGARDGDIILLHDLYAPSVNGAIRAMKDMIAGDYEFLTVTELLSRNGKAPKPSTSYSNG